MLCSGIMYDERAALLACVLQLRSTRDAAVSSINMKIHLVLVPILLCVACFLVCYLHLDFEAKWLEDARRPFDRRTLPC
jgi:hypothetical protein